ncbi:MAG: type II toxin-antitoxin system RelE/ParE family toxin [Pyrinomonadaceae bacterium]
MGKYRLIPSDEKDIEEILIYIAGHDLDTAMAFYERLTAIFEMLADNNEAGRERDEIGDGLRSFPVESYIVFYRHWASNVAIVRVIHAARDLDEIFS